MSHAISRKLQNPHISAKKSQVRPQGVPVIFLFRLGFEPVDRELPLRIYDVGVDANDYKPVGIDEIAAFMHLDLTHNTD